MRWLLPLVACRVLIVRDSPLGARKAHAEVTSDGSTGPEEAALVEHEQLVARVLGKLDSSASSHPSFSSYLAARTAAQGEDELQDAPVRRSEAVRPDERDGLLHDGDIVNTPVTDRMVATSRQELALGRFAVELESGEAKEANGAQPPPSQPPPSSQQQAKRVEEPRKRK